MPWWGWLLAAFGTVFSIGFFVLLGWLIHFASHFMDGW